MSNFKIGDRVRFIYSKTSSAIPVGSEGTVIERREGWAHAGAAHVSFDNVEAKNYPGWICDDSNLELIEPESQKIVDIAKSLVYGDRGETYGHPAEDYKRVALIWSGILGVEITPIQAIQCMVGIKLSRLSNTPDHRDSWVDIAGYAECGDRINRYEAGDKNS